MENISKYYIILGLAPGASQHEIKEAYRDLVRIWHPDRFTYDSRLRLKAEEKLKGINRAYERIKNLEPAAAETPRARVPKPWKVSDPPISPPAPPSRILKPLSFVGGLVVCGLAAFFLVLTLIESMERVMAEKTGHYYYAVVESTWRYSYTGLPESHLMIVAKLPTPKACLDYLRDLEYDMAIESKTCLPGDGRYEKIFNHESREDYYVTYDDPRHQNGQYSTAVILQKKSKNSGKASS